MVTGASHVTSRVDCVLGVLPGRYVTVRGDYIEATGMFPPVAFHAPASTYDAFYF